MDDRIQIMNMDEFKDFMESLGPNVEIKTPQFDRDDGIQPVLPSTDSGWFDRLKTLPPETLKQIGCGIWEEGHYLYPAEWYDFIPNGYEIVNINNEVELFRKGHTDNDRRFGMLSFGFKGEAKS